MTTLQQSLDLLCRLLGNRCVITKADQLETYHKDWRGLSLGQALAVVQPETVEDVCKLMVWANQHHEQGICVVPVGGRTGLCGGALPLPEHFGYHSVLLDLTQLNHISPPDTLHGSIYAQAGATLAQVQSAAQNQGFLFPISLASEGSCTIGGNIATNAGGTAVLHYGMMRVQCLSLDVVLPNGEQVRLGAGLHKDNSGYDLKQMWIGAEGTLGIIVGATLKLYPQVENHASVIIQSVNEKALLDTFMHLRAQTGSLLTTFEMFSERCLELLHTSGLLPKRFESLLTQHLPNTCYGLIELSLPPVLAQSIDANDLLARALSLMIEKELITSSIVAQSQADRNEFWQLRENIPTAQTQAFKNSPETAQVKHAKHDVALPISGILPFLNRVRNQLQQALGSFDEIVFGHLGDGNLHYNIAQVSTEQIAQINQIVYDCAIACGGSISAEHGIGYIRREALATYVTETKLKLMHTIKRAIDPNGIMNPNKILPSYFDQNPHFQNNSWGLSSFQQAQQTLADDVKAHLIYLTQTHSSNDVARHYLSEHGNSCVVLAEYQQQGRGQRGRSWISKPRQGLLCSIGLQINRADLSGLSGLSLVVGLCLRQGLFSYLTQEIYQQSNQETEKQQQLQKLDQRLKIKWPNDLYFANQKLGGILIESHQPTHHTHDVVIGFGLNLLEFSAAGLSHESTPTSLQILCRDLNLNTKIHPAKLWAKLIHSVFAGVKQFETGGFARFQPHFQTHLLWKDQAIFSSEQPHLQQHEPDSSRIYGICRGVDHTGALLLETDQGLRYLHSGSIRLDKRLDAHIDRDLGERESAI